MSKRSKRMLSLAGTDRARGAGLELESPPALCAKAARTSASVKTTGTRAGRFARSTL